MKESERFYGFTDFRGKPEKRGRGGHGSANQVTAGLLTYVAGGRRRLNHVAYQTGKLRATKDKTHLIAPASEASCRSMAGLTNELILAKAGAATR